MSGGSTPAADRPHRYHPWRLFHPSVQTRAALGVEVEPIGDVNWRAPPGTVLL
jgi:hypothetical protein